jgi:hypothetical protein
MGFGARWPTGVLALVGTVVVASCKSPDQQLRSIDDPSGGCNGPVTIVVSGGTTPVFSWSPGCGVNRLLVERVDPAPGTTGPEWSANSTFGLFGPPITYGTLPDGAYQDVSPRSLTAGTTYRVIVFRAAYEAIAVGVSSATFTP